MAVVMRSGPAKRKAAAPKAGKPPALDGPRKAYAKLCAALDVDPTLMASGRRVKNPALASKRCQAAMALKDALSLSDQQVADIMGLQVSTIGKGLARLRKAMSTDPALAARVKGLTNAARKAAK